MFEKPQSRWRLFVKYAGKALLVALVATFAACSDNTFAPDPQTHDVQNVTGGGVTSALSAVDTTRFSMTISPWSTTTVQLGSGNYITFPPSSVCDPATSGYGA